MEIKDFTGILADVATCFSLGFVAYQAAMFKKDYRVRNDVMGREKAIELTQVYVEKILVNLTYVNHVLSKAKVEECFKKFKYSELRDFDKHELESFMDKEEIENITKKIRQLKLSVLVNSSIRLRSTCIEESIDIYNKAKKYEAKADMIGEVAATSENPGNNADILSEKDYKMLRLKYDREFQFKLSDTLNLLEYFCMAFNSDIADEEVVYQSLHQSFLGAVKSLYFTIARKNENGKDKYYTNIITLYNKWSIRHNEQSEFENSVRNKSIFMKDQIKK